MSEEKTTTRKKKRTTAKKRSVVDSAVRNAAALTDGCNPELVIGAKFDGIFEMPIIKKPKKFIIPDKLVPFSKMDKADPKTFAVCEYENDVEFKDLLVNPDEYISILKKYQGFISPDCSVYRDMPLALQITNIYRSRAIGYCFQKHGVYVIPCVRWGDERTYTRKYLPERVAFLGVEKHSIVSVGSYGQLKDRVNRYFFEAGLDAMMETLEPEVVLVYSQMPDDIEEKYPETRFIEYPDWTSTVRKEREDNGSGAK
ncbi:MAG: DUF4417 domain-containing protein [Lachnospiraceae bacterium]|nr:DUF4417 domain-containing protein [Lachnospiraceae bacterium]